MSKERIISRLSFYISEVFFKDKSKTDRILFKGHMLENRYLDEKHLNTILNKFGITMKSKWFDTLLNMIKKEIEYEDFLLSRKYPVKK